MSNTNCPICGAVRKECFRAKILNKYDIGYWLCDRCGLLQTEKPFWLNEAYSRAITSTDTGLVARNISLARIASVLIYFLVGKNGRHVDAAGGYGLLTRLMRDIGFDFYWSDPYCENLHAVGFEATQVVPPFDVVTAFEVLEHVENPLEFIDAALNSNECRTLIFTTMLYEGAPPMPGRWWYYGVEHGQHISFFQRRTLETIAKKNGLYLHTHGYVHVLTTKKISRFLFWLMTSRIVL